MRRRSKRDLLRTFYALFLISTIFVAGILFYQAFNVTVEAGMVQARVEIFYSQRDEALKKQSKEEVKQILNFVVNYYPSGTVFESGGIMDRVQEKVRYECLKDTINHLRAITGEDLGDDPQVWVKRYALEKVGEPVMAR